MTFSPPRRHRMARLVDVIALKVMGGNAGV